MLAVGLLVGPLAVCCFAEAERSAPRGTAVAAFTSVTAVGLTATAGGHADAGWIVDGAGPVIAMLVAAAIVAVGAAAAAVCHSG